ncbi:MAG: peptide ABC transporter substrate-binding protein, partial [Chloroflexota bacterium]
MPKNLVRLVAAVLITVMAFGSFVSAQEDEEVLNILYWQAVSTMNPFLSGGTKDIEAASLVLEPLARYDETG